MENKRVAKFLAFDSLKGLKESIEASEKESMRRKNRICSEDEKEEMDILLHKSYILQEMVVLSVFHQGKQEEIMDVIQRIDPVKHRIRLRNRGYIYLAEIQGIRSIDNQR